MVSLTTNSDLVQHLPPLLSRFHVSLQIETGKLYSHIFCKMILLQFLMSCAILLTCFFNVVICLFVFLCLVLEVLCFVFCVFYMVSYICTQIIVSAINF